MFRGFPIGSILLWETEDNIESASCVGPIEIISRPSGLVSYLLDGQQRVSALVGTLQLRDEGESIKDQVDWRVYFDLEKSEFVRAPREGVTAQYFPMASLLDTSEFLAVADRIRRDVGGNERQRWLSKADHLANAFRNYQLPLIRIREANLDSAVTVFARLNRTGRKISADQMVSALTYRKGDFHLAEKLDLFQEELRSQGFGSFNRDFLFRAILAALDLDIYASEWAALMVKDDIRSKLPERFDLATKGVVGALAFLNGIGVVSDRLLPYGLQLVLLGEFYRLCPNPKPEVVTLLKRWFWVTSFSGWFGAVNPSKVRHVLHEIRELAREERDSFNVVKLDEQALPFPDRFDGRSARVRAFMLYLSSLNPLSVRPQKKELKLRELLSMRGTNAVGYIWKEFSGIEEYTSIPANRMFLDADVSGNAFDYLQDLEDYHLKKVLSSHGFPEDSLRKFRENDRIELIRMRQENLVRGEKEFMQKRQIELPSVDAGNTVADSEASDAVY